MKHPSRNRGIFFDTYFTSDAEIPFKTVKMTLCQLKSFGFEFALIKAINKVLCLGFLFTFVIP
jgi:hypothetical protein|tara:strand:- start:564 stop:752 length:189 start_codon:yes stop_codon:yes gene_type:complete